MQKRKKLVLGVVGATFVMTTGLLITKSPYTVEARKHVEYGISEDVALRVASLQEVLEETESDAKVNSKEPDVSFIVEGATYSAVYAENTTEEIIEETSEYVNTEYVPTTEYVNTEYVPTTEEVVEVVTVSEPEYVEPAGSGVLTAQMGVNYYGNQKETYYNLDMSGVISIMRSCGYSEEEYPYWVREDGVKMLGGYVMIAANLDVHPRGSIVETSLGTAIVCDTGGFAVSNPYQVDIAVSWQL